MAGAPGKRHRSETADQGRAARTRQAAAAKRDRSFETILGRYIKARRRDGVRKVDEDERDFNRECLPVWEGRAVDDITMADILKVIETIRDRGETRQASTWRRKSARFSTGAPTTTYPGIAIPAEARRIALGERQSRDRVLTDDEIRAFWKATGEIDPTYRDVYRRPASDRAASERYRSARHGRKSTCDKKTLTVPAARFKSDRDHVVPLTDDVIGILDSLPRWKNCSWVFSLDGEHAVTISDKVKRGSTRKCCRHSGKQPATRMRRSSRG